MMQYIDASMVGSMGAEASASIGIVETTVWLLGSICSATAAGFYVQVSHQLGADDGPQARDTLRQGIVSVLAVSMVLSLTALAVSPFLPVWLGGNADINASASAYFAIIAMGIPAFQFSIFGSGMLRSSGNMVVPSIMSVVMMSLDVVFNFFLIFPTRTVSILGTAFTMPGAGLSVEEPPSARCRQSASPPPSRCTCSVSAAANCRCGAVPAASAPPDACSARRCT